MPTPADHVPDGWDFDRSFLEDPQHLPPYVSGADCALFGTARRVTPSDLRELGLLPDATPTTHLEQRPHTTILPGVSAIADDRDDDRQRHVLHGPARLVIPEELLNRHWLLIGPPGCGKSTQGVMPITASLLLDRRRSLVVFDPKGDQFGVIRDLAVAAGRTKRSVLRLNLADPGGSIGWNPLRRSMTRTEALGIASTLVMASEPEGSRESPFWRNTSIELLVDMLLGLAADPTETLTLPRLLEVLNLPRPNLMSWLHEHDVHRFGSFLQSGSHNAETCLSDTIMRLVSLLDLDLCAVLSHGELRLEHLFEKPTVLVIEMNETRLAQQRPIFNMLAQQVFDRAIEAAEARPDARLPFPLSVVLDELGSAIGAIPRFPVHLNTLRSRRVGVVGAVQSLSQLRALYGEDAGAVVAGFSSKVFFPNVTPEDAEFASLVSGTMTVGMRDGGKILWVPRRTFVPDEIARPRVHPVLGRPATLLIADQPAFQAYLTPSFRQPRFAAVLAAQARRRTRPRRRHPLEYTPKPQPTAGGAAFTNTAGMPRTMLLRHLQAAEARISLMAATAEVQRFWSRLRQEHDEQPARIVRLAEELANRRLSATDLFVAHRECGCEDPQVVLCYLDYLQALHRHERRRRDAS